MDKLTQIIGQRLRARRLELGYSQEVTAEKADLHPTYIGQVERGEKNATIESVEKICIALEYPMEDLFQKLTPLESQSLIAQKCYNLISTQPIKEQKQLYTLLEDIIRYKHSEI